MKNRLYWIALGGLSFWLPAMLVNALNQKASLWMLNITPLAGVILLGVVSWISSRRLPKWGWVLAGVYILGPAFMLAPSKFVHAPSSPNIPGENIWVFLFCLFPPMTLWMAVLNGMLFAVLIVTVALPFLAATQARGVKSKN